MHSMLDDGGWNLGLRRLLNDGEMEEMTKLLSFLDTCLLNQNCDYVRKWSLGRNDVFTVRFCYEQTGQVYYP